MSNRVLPRSIGLIFPLALCLSCQTTPRTAEPHNPSAKASPEEERYKKMVEDRPGLLWYRLAEIHANDLQLGTVKTTFEIPAEGGHVRNLRVTSNSGGRMDELIARQAIDQLRAPPVPPALLAELQQDHIDFEESFTIFPKR